MKYIKLITLCLALILNVGVVKAMDPDDIVSTFFTLHGPMMEPGFYPPTEEGVVPPFLYITLGDNFAVIWARAANSPVHAQHSCFTSNPEFVDKLRQAKLGNTIYATMPAYGNCDLVEVTDF